MILLPLLRLLDVIYFMGIVNVVTAVLLYNGKDLDVYVCA